MASDGADYPTGPMIQKGWLQLVVFPPSRSESNAFDNLGTLFGVLKEEDRVER